MNELEKQRKKAEFYSLAETLGYREAHQVQSLALPPAGHSCPYCAEPGTAFCAIVGIERLRGRLPAVTTPYGTFPRPAGELETDIATLQEELDYLKWRQRRERGPWWSWLSEPLARWWRGLHDYLASIVE